MDSFSFKGTSSSANLIINSLPPITKPQMRVKEIVIDGKDGSSFEDLGYSSYDKKIKATMKTDSANTLINWLKGEGNLTLSNESDKYYKAKVVNQIDINRLSKYEPFEIVFRVQPYKYKLSEASKTISTSGGTVTNAGLEKSKPIFTITGSGTIEVSVNGTAIFTYTFPSGETSVVIDSEKEDAYLGNVLKNRNMTGEFPILNTGSNTISWTGTITNIVIIPNSRWL